MMTTVYAIPEPLAAYLRRATFGLPPKQRGEVWNELEEHILCRAERLEVMGLSREVALAQALRELGPPLRVSAAMNGVHNMPRMIVFGTLAVLAASAGFYALAGKGTQNLTAQTLAPRQICLPHTRPALPLERLPSLKFEQCYSDPSGTVRGIFLDAKGSEAVLKAIGLVYSEDGGFIRSHSPHGWGLDTSFILDPKLKVAGRALYNLDTVLPLAFEKEAGRLLLDNSTTPAFYDEQGLRLALGTPGDKYVKLVYTSMGELVAPYLYGIGLYKTSEIADVQRVSGPPVTVQTSLKAGELVGAFRWAASSQDPAYKKRYLRHTLRYDVGTVDAWGRVKLRLPAQAQFARDIPQRANPRWVLVRLTNTPLNNLKSGIFLPKQ